MDFDLFFNLGLNECGMANKVDYPENFSSDNKGLELDINNTHIGTI